MASKAAKFALIFAVFVAIGMLLYVSEYDMLSARFEPFISLHSRLGQTGNTSHTFHVESYNWRDGNLEVEGFYRQLGNMTIHNRTNQLEKLILKIEGLPRKKSRMKQNGASDTTKATTLTNTNNFLKVNRVVREVNCNAIFRNDEKEILRARKVVRSINNSYTDEAYIENTKDCPKFISDRGYVTTPLNKEEEEFPIAFSILMYTAVEQSERLLRAIYRPQNVYCIHVDNKTEQSTYDAMAAIASCFDNVFLTSVRYDVVWGTMTVLEPDLQCMAELYNKSKTWKYFINLTGQEFPLRTNQELVEILKAFNGANDIEGTRERANPSRWRGAGDPPHKIIPGKGSLHVVASRGYVDFVLHDHRAKAFLDWCRKIEIPDETFFTSLNHNPHLLVPGSYTGVPETFSSDATNEKPFVARFKNWGDGVYNWPCAGTRVRLICVFGVGDLPLLATRKELFANKFQFGFEPMAYDCMEELLFNHTRDGFLGKISFNSTWYRNLGFVKNKIKL